MEERHPGVGIGLMILKDGKVLLGKRKNSRAAGVFSTPGGRLEMFESFEECAQRETREETGLRVENIRIISLTNLYDKKEDWHNVTINLAADWAEGEPQNLEPEKCEGWEWYDPEQLPEHTLPSTRRAIEILESGHFYTGTIALNQ